MSAFKILLSKGILSSSFHQHFALHCANQPDLIVSLRGYIGKVGPSQIPALLHSDQQDRTLVCLNKSSSIRIIEL